MAQQQLKHWLVTIPVTITDANLAASTRPSHIQHLKALCDQGTILFSGPTLKEHPKQGQAAAAITGTVFVIKAESEEQVREIAKDNPFAKVGIWDVAAATVVPYILALTSG